MENRAEQLITAYDRPDYLRYDDLTSLVQAFAVRYPSLARLESIGQSPDGREIWCLTVTSPQGPAPHKKPAILLEGNIHAGEVTASATALHTVKTLLTRYGTDKDVTYLLDNRTFYVIPRLAVDGAEFYLTTPNTVRSSPLAYPDVIGPAEGLLPEDLDGDGRIRLMRKQDGAGEWKISARDPRIMVRRQPDDWEGPFYRVFWEGVMQTEGQRAAQAVKVVRPNRGLDFNRNFPAHWSPEAKQPGAGRYPLDQAETRALADFMLAHPNISIYLALHTSGGVLLRPPSLGGDETIPPSDLRLFETLGNLCQRTAGYPCRSSYFAFFHTPGQPMTKGSKDWAYEHLGLIAYTMELWDFDARAGAHSYRDAGVKGLMKLDEAAKEEDEFRRLQWNDRELGGAGFKDWTSLPHPQLGEVEIGGWDEKFVKQNCPLPFLPDECKKVSDFVTRLGLTLPQIAIGQVRVTPLVGSAWRVEVEVQNHGFLGTATTRTATEQKVVKPVSATLDLPAGAVLLSGIQVQELGQLEGYSSAADPVFGGAPAAANSTAWAEWVLVAPAGAQLSVTAASPRGGEVTRTIRLG